MRIDQISVPSVEGVPVDEAVRRLQRHCRETAVVLMRVNNDVEDLKAKLAELERRLTFG